MMNTSRVIQILLDKYHLTISEMARRVGIAQPALYRIATGETKNSKVKILLPIAQYFEISIDQLIGIEPLEQKIQGGENNDINEPINANNISNTKIPLIEWEQIASWLSNKNNSSYKLLATNVATSQKTFALQLKNSAMRPLLPEGTIVIIDPERTPKNQDFALVQMGKQPPIFKQLLIEGDNIQLKSLNPEFPAYKLNEPPHYLGTLVQAKTNFHVNLSNGKNSKRKKRKTPAIAAKSTKRSRIVEER